jgi:hypothetical protein
MNSITIQLKPILIKFLKYHQALSPEEPLRFPKQHFINEFLKVNLINPFKNKSEALRHHCLSLGDSWGEVQIAIPMFSHWNIYLKKHHLPIKKKQLFVKIIKERYDYEFKLFYWQNHKGKSKQKIADLWLEKLNVDDEILSKSQWRAIYRKIKS